MKCGAIAVYDVGPGTAPQNYPPGVDKCKAIAVFITGSYADLELSGNLISWGAHVWDYFVDHTYDTVYPSLVTAATIMWPDGSGGSYALVTSQDELVMEYTATHADSGLTATQPLITRNAAGYITNKPPLTVA